MIFSPLNPAKLTNNKGKHKTTKIHIFKLKSFKIVLTERKTKVYQSKLTRAVE